MTEEIRTEELADLIRAEADIASRAGQSDVLHAIADKVERLQRGARELGRTIEQQCNMVLDVTGLHDWVDETGDGDWGAIWDHALALKGRVEKAEADAVAREDAARREALLEAANRWVDERTDLLKSREAWRERAEAAESTRTGDGWPEALREQGRVLRALGVAIEWEQIAREQRPHLGCLDMYNHCAGELRAALVEPERDEEGGR